MSQVDAGDVDATSTSAGSTVRGPGRERDVVEAVGRGGSDRLGRAASGVATSRRHADIVGILAESDAAGPATRMTIARSLRCAAA